MILELYTKKGTFLTLDVKGQSDFALRAEEKSITIFCKGFETKIDFNEKFDVLINLVKIIREDVNIGMHEKRNSLEINLDAIIQDIKLDLE
ncbi:hypothetical protein RLQ69_000413 [Campylobacter jejuni]|uniref:Uncharacterized protein n=1 Tax=Campylobacter jejuni TaxID=197 RepID=A0A5C4YE89_CAMJU|nr:hypothetical protein [Campylobacter jejuni]EAH8791762.1 hypothetical protein [Campylobacter jejuni]EAI4846039.1 hypothetical protein [Campylobacter jejuni]EAI6346094.1 hypothetical protein [Campylobacter jejuni]EAI8630664.1 hypothetical protein [Campylobacter jejuni]EAJ5193003.1 hypothetical protein [Campylobacter jejuni]